MTTYCTFASAAFASNAFEVCAPVTGGGGGYRFVLDMRRFAARQESPTKQEVEELVTEARARLRFKAVPYVVADLTPLIERMKRAREEKQLADFRAALDVLLALDDLQDAA